MKIWKIDRDMIVHREAAVPMSELVQFELVTTDRDIQRRLEFWMKNPASRQKVMDAYTVMNPGPPLKGTPDEITKKVVDALMRSFRSKALALLERKTVGGGGGEEEGGGGGQGGSGGKGGSGGAAQNKKKAAEPPPKKTEEKTWIKFQLFDEDGQPMKNEKFKLGLPDGSSRDGKLDAEGSIYIPPTLDPNKECTVSFPEIHLNPRKKKK
ncbi:MAG: hypothetical protein K2X35_05540 [Bryobacteraceae bacterium]|nr:hypothetical protein [Bryobacteraceae bacterium]